MMPSMQGNKLFSPTRQDKKKYEEDFNVNVINLFLIYILKFKGSLSLNIMRRISMS